ncbi:MAG: hypothetical protein AAGE84_07680 [Cyanobacteria bacterium P01_G01_bin.39]
MLESKGLESEVAAYISSFAGLASAIVSQVSLDHDHQLAALSLEKLEAIPSVSKTSEISSEAAALIAANSNALVEEMENIIASVEKGHDYSLNNLDTNKTEEIFSQIDLTQARISKDQEEIQSLANETDNLLNQLEYKAS